MVEQLTKNPAWRFVWSEVCWLDKWWERASQSQKDSFTRFKFGFWVFHYVHVGFQLLTILHLACRYENFDKAKSFRQ